MTNEQIIAKVLELVDAYEARTGLQAWTRTDRTNWRRATHAPRETMLASLAKAEEAWGLSVAEVPLAIYQVELPRDELQRACQVMHAVELWRAPEAIADVVRVWAPPTWLQTALGVVGFVGGLAWGLGGVT